MITSREVEMNRVGGESKGEGLYHGEVEEVAAL
jgi:hypothetical protein